MQKIILFGASDSGKTAYLALKDKMNVCYFCDNDPKKWGERLDGVEIIPPKKLLELKDVTIVITSHYKDEIAFQLYKMGIQNYRLFSPKIDLYGNEKSNFNSRIFPISYSQEGEDMILKEIFQNKQEGFYVDVGAHHPKRFSNTYYFYKKGWRGINIEPLPGSKEFFDFVRPYDINLEMGVSNQTGEIQLYMFNEPALNTFDFNIAQERVNQTNYKMIDTKKVKIETLKNILDNYASFYTIDFMSIDVEGFEFNVVNSNDWLKYRPQILLIESIGNNVVEFKSSLICQFLEEQGYTFFAKTLRTCFFKINSWNF